MSLLQSSGKEQAEAFAEATAAQMLAEMLSMVCHPEYFLHPPQDQTVYSCQIFANLEGIVIHFDGFHACVYFATFPSQYLETLRNEDIGILRDRQPKIKLNHTRLYNLFMTDDRTDFIEEFVALLRFVAAGEAKVGHLRKDSEVIHRRTDGNGSGEVVSHAPQQAQDESEARTWMDLERYKFEDWIHNLHRYRLPALILQSILIEPSFYQYFQRAICDLGLRQCALGWSI